MVKKARSDMPSESEPAPTDAQNQIYDNVLKRLFEKQARSIIPMLFGPLALEVLEELTIEIIPPLRRMDRAYKTRSEDGPEVLDIEFETSASKKIDKRLLVYHAVLLEKYELPVTSLVIYPFEKPVVESPLVETKGSRQILRFDYQTLYLPTLDASLFMDQGAVPVYALLPAMGKLSDGLLLQSIEDMIQYCGDDEALLRDELMCFAVLLRRAQPLPEVQLDRVLRRIRMFDQLLEEDPWVKEKVAEGEAKGRVEGEVKGEAKGASKELVRLVRRHYPALLDLAQARTAKGEPPDVLEALIEQLWDAPNEQAARTLLETSPTGAQPDVSAD